MLVCSARMAAVKNLTISNANHNVDQTEFVTVFGIINWQRDFGKHFGSIF